MILIGVDPPKGLAVWDTELRKFTDIRTVDFWFATEIIHKSFLFHLSNMAVVIEAPQVNKPTFYRPGQNARAMSRISQNVGSNKRDSVLIIEYCQRMGIKCIPVPPRRSNSTKNDPELFKRLTGWPGRTSEHGRDAGMLVFGMTPDHIK